MRLTGAPARLLAAGAVIWLLAVPRLWVKLGDASTLDGAWMTSMADAWRWDHVSGRDFYASYGWGFQALSAFAVRLHGENNAFDSAPLIEVLSSWLGALGLGVALFASRRLNAPGIFLVGAVPGLLSLTQYAWSRPVSLVLVAIATARTLELGPRTRPWALGVIGGLATGLQALSFDTGILATCLVLAGGGWVLFRRFEPDDLAGWNRRSLLERVRERSTATARTLAPAAIGVVLCNAVALAAFARGSSALFDYPRTLVALAAGYRFTLASSWTLPPSAALAIALVGAFVVAATIREASSSRASSGAGELPLLALASLLALLGGVVRPDIGHLNLAIVPLVVTCGYATLRPVVAWRVRVAGSIALLALFIVWPTFGFGRLLVAGQALASPLRTWSRVVEFRHLAPSAAVYLPTALRAGDSATGLLAFPYQNQWALLAGRRPVAPFIQAYQATTASLDRQYVERLAAEEPFEVLFGLDDVVSHRLEEVQSVSRNPLLFEFLWQNFRPLEVAEGYARMVRAEVPRQFVERRLSFEEVAPVGELARLHFTPAARCTLLRLRIAIDYPLAAAVGRPSRVRLSVARGEAPLQDSSLVRLGGGFFSTLVSLVPGAEFATVLEGHAAPREFDQLAFSAADATLLAVAPRRLSVESVDCLTD